MFYFSNSKRRSLQRMRSVNVQTTTMADTGDGWLGIAITQNKTQKTKGNNSSEKKEDAKLTRQCPTPRMFTLEMHRLVCANGNRCRVSRPTVLFLHTFIPGFYHCYSHCLFPIYIC